MDTILALQWGRDQLVAEISFSMISSSDSTCFNGAAANWSRK